MSSIAGAHTLASQSMRQISPTSSSYQIGIRRSQSKQPDQIPLADTYGPRIAENKEILKMVSQLSSIISSMKRPVTVAIDMFGHYSPLWETNREEAVQSFVESSPLLSDFHAQLHHYRQLQQDINAELETLQVGPLCLVTGEDFILSTRPLILYLFIFALFLCLLKALFCSLSTLLPSPSSSVSCAGVTNTLFPGKYFPLVGHP